MANSWFRLWTDMVNDPKWRTIARVSKQKVGDVIAVYVHMMTMAANATERGRTEGFNDEDVATALDIDTEQVTAIREAMQGRVLDGDRLTGWEKRQPVREDGASERGKAFRERKKAEKERDRTQANATERQIREEEIREEEVRGEPATPPLPASPSRIGEICVLLRRAGVNTSPDAVGKVEWSASPRVTDDILDDAVVLAKKRSPRQITPAYLTPIIADLLAKLDAARSAQLVAGKDYV